VIAADTLRKYWVARSPKERLAAWIAGAVLLATLIYFSLLGPALAAREQLAKRLPELRAQLDDMQQQAKEITALRKKLGDGSKRTELKALLQSSAARTSFVNAVERLDADGGDRAILRAAPVVFDDWLAWAEYLQREFGVRLESCRISALDLPGLVRIEATFTVGQASAAKKP